MDEGPNARIAGRDDAHESLATFRVAPQSGAVTPFEPGQFVSLGLPDETPSHPLLRRAFSIASSPAETRHYELFVRRVDEGRFTARLFALREGDPVWLDPRVFGRFTLDEAPRGADLVLVATGTGVGPFLSMLRTYAGSGRWRRLALIHGVRETRDLVHREEIERKRLEDASVAYLPTVSRAPGSGWSGLRGRVQELLEPDRFADLTGFTLDPERAHVFLCGNPEMIEDVSSRLCALGFRHHSRRSPGQIHRERYW